MLDMTTKEQEQEALDQIRKIVESLGEDSYVGTALQGCLEDAQSNINSDIALSMMGRYEQWKQQAIDYGSRISKLKRDLKIAEDAIKSLEGQLKDARDVAFENAEQCDEARRDAAAQEIRANEAETRATVAESEVVCLKAKLYDYMIGGGA
jgi:chromosome segregation ATPase